MVLWIILVCTMGAAVLLPLSYFIWMHSSRMQRCGADALIVLGYRCDEGRIHPLLQERLDLAIELYRNYAFSAMIVSGGAVTYRKSEAEIMRDYLLDRGIPETAILLEDRSRNTVHNVVNCRIIMQQHGWHSCLLVSNSFHIRRMKYIMKQLNMPAYFCGKQNWRSILGRQWRLTFQEIRAYKLTLPWVEQARRTGVKEMMGNS